MELGGSMPHETWYLKTLKSSQFYILFSLLLISPPHSCIGRATIHLSAFKNSLREECRLRVFENKILRWILRVTIHLRALKNSLREECRLRVFENRILRRIFGPRGIRIGSGEGVEELHSMYRSPNIVRVIKCRRLRWAGHVARMEEGTSAFKTLTGKPTGKRPFGRPRHRCENNIRMDLKGRGVNTRDWVNST